MKEANSALFEGEDKEHNYRVLDDIQGVVSERAKKVFSDTGAQSFFAGTKMNPGLKLEGEIKQAQLADGTRLMIAENGAIVVTGLTNVQDSDFTKVSALRQENNPVIGYHDFPLTWDQTRWLWLDIKEIKDFEQLKAKITEYQQPQP